MNKNTGVIFGVIVLIVIAGGIYASNKSSNEVMMADKVKDTAMVEKNDKAMIGKDLKDDTQVMMKDEVKKADAMMKSGSYEIYSSEKVMMASATHNVVLFFRASWCPTCISVDKDIKANLGKIPANLSILDVDYDNSVVLKKKYGVTYQHTFVQVDKDGNLIKKWSGSPTLSALISEVK